VVESLQLSDEEQEWLREGISLFDSSRFWDAHEAWEDLWKSLRARQADPPHVHGIQGLIQCAAVLLKVVERNSRGVVNLWAKLTDKLGTPDEPELDNLWVVNVRELLNDLLPFVEDAATEDPAWALDPTSVKLSRSDS